MTFRQVNLYLEYLNKRLKRMYSDKDKEKEKARDISALAGIQGIEVERVVKRAGERDGK